MYTYQQIDELFGVPLNTVTKPHVPFKFKGWHLIGGLVFLGLATYGAICLYDKITEDKKTKLKNKRFENYSLE